MSDCNHDCGSCSATCSERQEEPGIQKAPMNQLSDVKKVIGIVSGTGGVGKSSVTSMLAAAARRQGKSAGQRRNAASVRHKKRNQSDVH